MIFCYVITDYSVIIHLLSLTTSIGFFLPNYYMVHNNVFKIVYICVSAQYISKLHFIQQIVNVKIYYVSKFSNILFPNYQQYLIFPIFLIKMLYTKMYPSTQIFSPAVFYICCLKSPQSKSVPQESVKEDRQQNELVFMSSQYPCLFLQNIHSTSVGVYNSFIREEMQLQF